MENYKEYKIMKTVAKITMAIIIIIVVIGILMYFREKKNEKQIFFNMGNNITRQASETFESWVEDQIRVVKTIAKDKRVIEACINPQNEEKQNKATEYLCEMHNRYPYYENLPISIKSDKDIVKNINGEKVTVKNGTFLLDTVGGKTIGKSGMDYSYVKEIFKGKQYYISEIYPSILRNNPIFVISCPVKYNDEIVGVAIISPQVDYFAKRFIESINLEKTGYMFFMNEKGTIIAHRNRNYILNESKDVKKIFERALKKATNGESNFEEVFLGDKKLYVSTKVKINKQNSKYSWYILFTQQNGEIFASTNKLLGLIIIMVFVSAIFISFTVYIILKINQNRVSEKNLIEMNKALEKKVKERTKELQQLAVTDSLTNLFNHNTSYELLEKEINKSKESNTPLSVIMLDLDHFKKVNDNYGHQVGDKVLKAVSKVIKNTIRKEDIPGRYGGEEFIIIFPKVDKVAAILFAQKIKKSISQINFNEKDLHITASIGVCTYTGETGVELVNKADKLLYKAKKNGRNRIEV